MNISANIAYNHNEITDMGNTNNVIQGSDSQQILRKGEALGAFYGLQFQGIVQQGDDVSILPTINGQTPKPGDLKFQDTNQDGKIDVDPIEGACTFNMASGTKVEEKSDTINRGHRTVLTEKGAVFENSFRFQYI